MAPLRSLLLHPPSSTSTFPSSSSSSSSPPSSFIPHNPASHVDTAMSTSALPSSRLAHSRHASRERDDNPFADQRSGNDSVLTFQSVPTLAGGPIYATVEPSRRKEAHKKLAALGFLLALFFTLNALWLFGSYHYTPQRINKLDIAVVDFDGGAIGAALLASANVLDATDNEPTFKVLDGSSTTPAAVQKLVFDGHYWGAVVANAGASDRFTAAAASDAAAATYDATSALEYIGLEVRYNTVWGKYLKPALVKVVEGTQTTFAASTVAPLLTTGATYGAVSASVLVNPIGSKFINPAPFDFGSRVLLNTAGLVFPILLIAFFLSSANTWLSSTGYYRNIAFKALVRYKTITALVWTLVTALLTTVWFLMFDENYKIGVKYWFALLALLWVFSLTYFNLISALYALTSSEHISAANPLIIFTLVVLSLTATSHPLILQNPFFFIQYAFPSHATWEVAMVILGHGALKSVLKYDLPILVAWLVATSAVLYLALKRKTREGLASGLTPAVVPVKIDR